MLPNPESLDLIARYLNHPSDPGLQDDISSFRSISAENEAYFNEMERIWKRSSAAATLEHVDVKEAQQNLEANLMSVKTTRTNVITWFKGIAASILLVGVGYWAYQESVKPNYVIKTTAKNQIDSVKLADGSTVILSENTSLRYPNHFSEGTREIFLARGKAFFKIAKDAAHPFKVVMDKSDVVVLGTSFNIKLTDANIELGVKTGRVIFSPFKGGATSILTAGQALSYDIRKKEVLSKVASNTDAWLTNELIFVDTPLEDVCKQLTEHYGVIIKLQSNKHAAKKLNARFINISLNDVLVILNETYNIKINKERNQINLITP